MFDSGVMVVQLQSHSEEEMIASALDNVSFTVTNIILTLTWFRLNRRALSGIYVCVCETYPGFYLLPCLISVSLHLPPLQVSDKGSLTAEEFAKLLGLSVLLSKER